MYEGNRVERNNAPKVKPNSGVPRGRVGSISLYSLGLAPSCAKLGKSLHECRYVFKPLSDARRSVMSNKTVCDGQCRATEEHNTPSQRFDVLARLPTACPRGPRDGDTDCWVQKFALEAFKAHLGKHARTGSSELSRVISSSTFRWNQRFCHVVNATL